MKRRLLLFLGISAFLIGGTAGCVPVQTLPSNAASNADSSAPAEGSAGITGADSDADNSAMPESTQTTGNSAAAAKTPDAAGATAAENTSGESVQQTTASTQDTSGVIPEDKAREISLKDAGVKESEVTGLRIRLQTDDGVRQYEVDFYAGNKEYDYDIKADDGTILSKDMDIDDDFRQNAGAQKANSPSVISREKATKIALKEVKGAVASDVRIHLDNDGGRQTYEGSILFNDTEYDFEIDAVTGNIIEWEAESIYD